MNSGRTRRLDCRRDSGSRPRRGHWSSIAVAVLSVAALSVVCGISLADSGSATPVRHLPVPFAADPGTMAASVTFSGRWHGLALGGVSILFFAVLGGIIGSFLNVVIHRLPLGMGLIKPDSHCPACGNPVRRRDNVPVFGWMILRGRCRDCGVPISARYPMIEAFVALSMLALAIAELFSGGANLPVRPIDSRSGILAIDWLDSDLSALYAYHCFLLCVLLCAVLIEYDGHALPRRLLIWAYVIGLTAPLFWAPLRPVPFWMPFTDSPVSNGPLRGALDGLFGLFGGALAGMLCGLGRRGWPRLYRLSRETVAVLGLVGLFLGWQAALSVAGLTLLARAPLTLRRFGKSNADGPGATEEGSGTGDERVRASSLAIPALATAAQIVLWRWLASFAFWPGPFAAYPSTLFTLFALGGVCYVTQRFRAGV